MNVAIDLDLEESYDSLPSNNQDISSGSTPKEMFLACPPINLSKPESQVLSQRTDPLSMSEPVDSDEEETKVKNARKRKENQRANAVNIYMDELGGHLRYQYFQSLSGTLVINKPVSIDLKLYYGKRVLSEKFKERFTEVEQNRLLSTTTKHQVVHLEQEATNVNLEDPFSIMPFLQDKGCNFKDAYSLQLLGEGGQSVVYRADLKQPIEAVVKSVHQRAKCQSSLVNLLEETAMINWLENKEFVVDIKEEILEFDQKSNEILNYIVVAEQALLDLQQISQIWIDPQQSLQQREFYSDAKLFYFAFKTAEALDYLHSHQIYYGDLKEQNILIFRDYSVKFGDFGVSLKLKAGGRNQDEDYELKGITSEYCLHRVKTKFEDDQDTRFSKLDLFQNDYWALFYTLQKVEKEVQNLEGYQKDSFFTQFLSDLSSLDLANKPLKRVITKWTKTLEQTPSFIFELCSQLNSCEKYSAIPNILKLSFNRTIPTYVQKYFEQEEAVEMPFLKPKQPSEIEEDREEEEQNHFQDTRENKININLLDKEAIVQLLKWQIGQWKDKGEQGFLFIEYLVKFKSHICGQGSNKFYRSIFSDYYQRCSGQEKDYLSMLESSPSEVLSIFFTLQQYLSNYEFQFRYFLSLFLFHGLTSAPDLKFINKLLDKLFFFYNQKGYSKAGQLVKKHLNIVFEIYLLHLRGHLADGSKFKQGLKMFDQFSKVGVVLENLQTRVLGLDNGEEKEIELLNNRDLQLARQNSIVVEYFLKNYKHLQLDNPQKQLSDLKHARWHLKLVYGELGDQMSLNAFQIYILHKELQKQNYPFSLQEENEAFNLLQKACSYSSKELKMEYLYDLMLELLENDMYDRFLKIWDDVYQEGQFLFWLLRKHFDKEIFMDSDATPARLEQFFNQETQQQLRKNLGQSRKFAEMIVRMFGMDEELVNYDADHLVMEMKVEIVIKRVRLVCKLQNEINSIQEAYGDYFFQFNTMGSKQQILLSFKDHRTTTIWLSQLQRDGELNHSLPGYSTQLRYVKGQILGPCRIVTPVFRLWGDCCNHAFNQAQISFINGDFYQGECKYWKRNGKGTQTRPFFLATTLTQKGIWNNGALVGSESAINEPGDFLALVLKNMNAVLFLLDETCFLDNLKAIFRYQFDILVSKIQTMNHQDVYPSFLVLYRLLVALCSLQNILTDLVRVSRPYSFRERVIEGRKLSAELNKCFSFIDSLSSQISAQKTHLGSAVIKELLENSLDALYYLVLEISNSERLELSDIKRVQELAPDAHEGVIMDMLYQEFGKGTLQADCLPVGEICRAYELNELVLKEENSEFHQRRVLEVAEEIAKFMALLNGVQNEKAMEFILSFFFLRKDVNKLPQKEVLACLSAFLIGKYGKKFEIEMTGDRKYLLQGKVLTGFGSSVEVQQIQGFFDIFLAPLDKSLVPSAKKLEKWGFSNAVSLKIFEPENLCKQKSADSKPPILPPLKEKSRGRIINSKCVEEKKYDSRNMSKGQLQSAEPVKFRSHMPTYIPNKKKLSEVNAVEFKAGRKLSNLKKKKL